MRSIVVALMVAGALAGCGGGTQGTLDPPPTAGVTNQEIVGHWSGNWGQMVLRVVDGEIRGTYSHDQGTIVALWQSDGALHGWWSEAPSRQPTADAGEVLFRFIRGAGLEADGRWRYGADGSFREDWDVTWTATPAPADLEARFGQPELFRRHP